MPKYLFAFLVGFLTASSIGFASSSGDPAAPSPVRSCSLNPDIQLDDLGTDGQGNFWTWNRGEAVVDLWADGRARLAGFEVPPSRGLALDRNWGLAWLDREGHVLTLRRPGSDQQRIIPLQNEAAAVAWIDENRLAIAPTRSAHLVEVWEVESGELVAKIGPTVEIRPAPGATFLRSMALAYSGPSKRLFVLNSLTGELKVFTLAGELLASARVPAYRYPGIEQWRQDLDARLKETGATQNPLFQVLRMTVDSSGNAWIVNNCDGSRRIASVTRVNSDGHLDALDLQLDSSSCSLNFARAGEDFLFVPVDSSETQAPSRRLLVRCSPGSPAPEAAGATILNRTASEV